jgi:dihydrolipoamide dehydrogenase
MDDNKGNEVVIIGAGPGGYAAAFRAADLGLKVTLIDPEANPGGVCLYRGCIPSKALLHLAHIKQEAKNAAEWGLEFSAPKVDPKKISKWKDKVVKKLTSGLGQLSKGRNIDYIRGRAVFTSESELEVKKKGGKKQTIAFQNVILATGSRIKSLPNIEIDHKVIIDSTDALEMKGIPKTMLVIGGGYIGLELGSVYAALGTKVSIAEMTSGFLPGTDRDLVEVFEKENKGLFEALFFETMVEKVSVKNGKATVILKTGNGKKEKKYDQVLVAVGRYPNTASVDTEKAGINLTDEGFVTVDKKQRTNVENVYAIGDLTGGSLLAHKATHEGIVAAEVIAGEKGAAFDPKAIPAIVFTHPEMGWAGLSESEAKERKIKVKVVKFPWSASGRAVTLGAVNGLTKLILEAGTGRILGGGVAGNQAGTLVGQITHAIEMASTAEDLALTIHPHPSLSETIMEAAALFMGSPTHLPKP